MIEYIIKTKGANMLNQNSQLKLSPHSSLYDTLIPKDHFLKQVKAEIDFGYVIKILAKNYSSNRGRNSLDPVYLFKLLFLKYYYNLSDERVVERSMYDLSFKYFLDLQPEDKLIDPSTLTVFRRERIKDETTLSELFEGLLSQAVSKGLIKGKAIIVDATHTESKNISNLPIEELKMQGRQLRKSIYQEEKEISKSFPSKPDEESLENILAYSEELLTEVKKHPISEKISKQVSRLEKSVSKYSESNKNPQIDTDAKKGYKSKDKAFYGYKTHIAMTEERIITGIEVTDGSQSDGIYLKPLIEKSKIPGLKIEEVIGDAAYSGKSNIEYDEDIKIIAPLNPTLYGSEQRKNSEFKYNKDADTMQCPNGNLAKSKWRDKERVCENGSYHNARIVYNFDGKLCQKCPKREGCYRSGTTRRYTVTIPSLTHLEQMKFEQSDYFKERYKQRYMIEAKNAEIKEFHGLHKAESVGLLAMQRQSYFVAFVVNVKRMIKLIRESAFFYVFYTLILEKNESKRLLFT